MDQSDLRATLPREHADQIGIVHRVEGMILERTFVERERADEQVALIDGACGLGKRRRDDGDCFAGVGAQGIEHRPDVAVIGRIEGGAILYMTWLAPRFLSQASAARACDTASAAAVERIFSDTTTTLTSGRVRPTAGNPDGLHGSQAAFRQRIGGIRRPGIVISNAAEWSE